MWASRSQPSWAAFSTRRRSQPMAEASSSASSSSIFRMPASVWAMRRSVRSSSAAAPLPVTASGLACQSSSIRSRATTSPCS